MERRVVRCCRYIGAIFVDGEIDLNIYSYWEITVGIVDMSFVNEDCQI